MKNEKNDRLTWGVLPAGWGFDRMKDVVDIRDEKVAVESAEVNYLELEDIESGSGRIFSCRDTLNVASAVTRFKKGDVLFGKLRPYLEKYCQPDFDGFCTGEILAFLPRRIHGRYLFYQMGSHWLIQRCNALAYGTKMPRVNWPKQLALFDVPLPSVPEQKRIAAYLDASCAAIDRAVETKQKQLETLDALRKSIITPSVLLGLKPSRESQDTGNPWLARIPRGWKLVALKRLSETQTGITLGKTYEPPLLVRPYLRAANVQDGYLDLERITTIEIPEYLAGRYELKAGDVLMTEGGDLDKLGRGFLWGGQIPGCLHQNHVFAIRTNPRLLLPQFLTYVTASRYGRDYFEATGKRTTNLASTNSTKVGLFPIPLPPLPEQQTIVDHIDAKLDQARRIEQTISTQIATLKAYRKSLIHECVTGKRRISDADVAKARAHV